MLYGMMIAELRLCTHTIADGIARLAHSHVDSRILVLKFFVLTLLELLKHLQTIDVYNACTVRNNVNYCH